MLHNTYQDRAINTDVIDRTKSRLPIQSMRINRVARFGVLSDLTLRKKNNTTVASPPTGKFK
jgi:hypothetical protein